MTCYEGNDDKTGATAHASTCGQKRKSNPISTGDTKHEGTREDEMRRSFLFNLSLLVYVTLHFFSESLIL